MKLKAVLVLAMFLLVNAVPMGLSVVSAANSPPAITVPADKVADVGQVINLASGLAVTDPEDDPLVIQWDYNGDLDKNVDGNKTNDNEYSGTTPKTNVSYGWANPGNYTIVITVSDATHTVQAHFKVTVVPVVGEKAGEHVLTQTKLGTMMTVARDGFISWKVFLDKGDSFRVKIDIAVGTGLAVLWVEEVNYPFMKSGSMPNFYNVANSKEAVLGTKLDYKKKAPSTGTWYIVFWNKKLEGALGAHISEHYVNFNMSIEDIGKPATINSGPILVIGAVVAVVAVIVVLAVYALTRKKKYVPMVDERTLNRGDDPLAHVPPDQRAKWQEWLDYEKTYGAKHPEAPYPLTKAAGGTKEAPKFENYTCPTCKDTLSYDNFTKMFYCYTCKKKVDLAHAVPPQPKAPPPAPAPAPVYQPAAPTAYAPQQPVPPPQPVAPPPHAYAAPLPRPVEAQPPPPPVQPRPMPPPPPVAPPQAAPPPVAPPPIQYAPPAPQPMAAPPAPPHVQPRPMPPPPPQGAPQPMGPPPPTAPRPMPPPPPQGAPQPMGPPPPPPAAPRPMPPPPPPGGQPQPLPPPPPPPAAQPKPLPPPPPPQ